MGQTSPESAAIGLLASVVIWTTGVWSLTHITATAIASAPASWRERFAPEYEEASAFRLRDTFLSAKTLYAAAFWAAAFVLLDLVDVMLVVQLGAAAAYAAWVTYSEKQGRPEDYQRRLADGLDPLPPNRGLSWLYSSALFAMWLGFFAAACFAAAVLVELVRG